MNISRDLNEQQRQAVYHYKGPALVLAGPGSGKTRVITYRVAYLIRQQGITPESILAVTFTNKAAQEMMSRLHNDSLLGETIGVEVWIHTFHAACVRILRQYGDKIGLKPNFAVIDQDTQGEIITQYIRDFGPSIAGNQIWLARDFISDAKIRLKDPAEPHETSRLNQFMEDSNSVVAVNDLLEVARRYQEYLKNHDALDFDDLVGRTVALLANCADIKDELHRKFQFVMVDEYQDINYAQYELIRHLCNPEKNIMAVADDDQSIYSWRGSDPSFIDRFKEQYDPRIIQLIEHFRSTERLLRASQSLIKKNTRRKKGSLITKNSGGSSIYHYKLDTVDQELRLVLWLIRRIIREKRYSPGQIAIFYRTHRLADKLEQYLLEHKVAVRRIRRESYFEDSTVRAIVGYLRLICWNLEPDMNKIINFPELIMYELTKLQLERIAKRDGVKFRDLLRRIDQYDALGPLSRNRIRQFIGSLDDFTANLTDEQVSKIIQALFSFLESRRSPYHNEDLSAIQSPDGSGGLWLAVNALYGSIQQKQPVLILSAYGIDNYSAAGIIMHVLQSYLDMGERAACHFLSRGSALNERAARSTEASSSHGNVGGIEDNPLYIVIGSLENISDNIVERSILIGIDDDELSERPVQCIANLHCGEGGVVATTALKLCQRLLSSYEAGNTDGLVVYDLETIGNDPRTAEIIEIGAKKLGSRREEDVFHELVNPRKFIPKSSTDIHGITNEDVRNKPTIENVLPAFMSFVGDNILVGHNIIDFDNKVMARYMSSHLGRAELPNVPYDTLSVARRLFPLENHKLDAIADKFSISYDRLHRAEADVILTEKVFRELRREDLKRGERVSLPEVLPLVAIGILEKNAAIEKENAAFYNAALRYLNQKREDQTFLRKKFEQKTRRYETGIDAVELLPITHLEAAEAEEAISFLDTMRRAEPSDTRDDMDWNAIKATFQNVVLDFEHSSYDKSLSAFLNYAVLLTNVDLSEEDEDKVTMMTAHSAKGTEFPVVIIIGMEQGNFPILRPDQPEEELEEERRLFYVGMTRAKEKLYVTSVRRRMSDTEKTPSQFIWEIHPELIKTVYADQIQRAWDRETQKRRESRAKAGGAFVSR